MGVKSTLEAAQKVLLPAMQQKNEAEATKGLREGIRLVGEAIKVHGEKQKKSGELIKQLSACITEMEQVMKSRPDPSANLALKKLRTVAVEVNTNVIAPN